MIRYISIVAGQPLYQVTPKLLIMMNADATGILAPGTTITLTGLDPYTIVPADTLTTVAAGLKIDIGALSDNTEFQKLT